MYCKINDICCTLTSKDSLGVESTNNLNVNKYKSSLTNFALNNAFLHGKNNYFLSQQI